MRELDVVLLRYLEQDFGGAPDAERAAFDTLLSLQDPDILNLLTGRVTAEDADLRHVVERILANSRSAGL